MDLHLTIEIYISEHTNTHTAWPSHDTHHPHTLGAYAAVAELSLVSQIRSMERRRKGGKYMERVIADRKLAKQIEDNKAPEDELAGERVFGA